MKIRLKITLIIGFLIAVSMSLVFAQYILERNRTNDILQGIGASEREYFEHLVELVGSGLAIFSSDYSFWDAMVAFVSDPDPLFAEENLAISLDTFEADELFVYDPSGELVYGATRDESPIVAPLLPSEAFSRFREVRLAHFFFYKEGVLTEYRIATIHPTNDPNRLSEPAGFFLVGKKWDSAYIRTLEELSDSIITVGAWDQGGRARGETSIPFTYDLFTWDGSRVETFFIETPVPLAALAVRASEQQIILVALSFLLILILVYVFLELMVGRPIRALSQGIERKDLRFLNELRTSTSEFGTLARLIVDFSEHELVLEAKAKDDAILAAVGSGLIVVDVDERIALVNTAAEKLLGISRDDARGSLASDIFRAVALDGAVVAHEERPLTRALREGGVITSKMSCIRADGTRFPTIVTAAPVILNGDVIGAVQDFRDITYEEGVERAKREFVALASHELRTPLTVLRWCVEELANRTNLSGKYKTAFLEPMKSAMNRMQSLIRTILDVSKIETEAFVTTSARISIKDLIQNMLRELAPSIQTKRLTLRTRLGRSKAFVHSDERLLAIAISSILENAVRYADEAGKVNVELTDEKDAIMVVIKNTGPGIPPEEQSQIFTKLFRASTAKAQNPDGTGLGLYISKSFIERLGGSISFTSEPNAETIFMIHIPKTTPKGE